MRHFRSTLALGLLIVCNSVRAAAEEPEKWIDRAQTAAREIADPTVQAAANDPLPRMLARSGDATTALAAAKGITETLPKLYVLREVAKAAHQAGDKKLCQQTVDAATQEAIDHAGPFYTQAYVELCFSAGLPQAAVEYADNLFAGNQDYEPLQVLAEGYAASGDEKSAQKLLIEKNLGDYGKYHVVKGLTYAKDFGAAIKLADTIEDSNSADQARSLIATALAHEGQEEKARQQAALMTEPIERSGLLGEVALTCSKNDSVGELRERFAAANNRDMKTALLNPLLEKLVEISAVDEAEQAIDAAVEMTTKDPRPAVSTMMGVYGDDAEIVWMRAGHLSIADKLIEQNKKDQAAAQIAKFEPLYDALSEDAALIKWPLAPQLVRTLVHLGDLKRAEDKLQEIETSSTRSEAAVPVAVHYIKAGDAGKGMQVVTMNKPDDENHGAEYNDVALALLDSVSAAKAAEFLETLPETEGSARAITDTARDLVEAKQFDKLEKLYGSVKSPFVRAYLATEAAHRLLMAEEK